MNKWSAVLLGEALLACIVLTAATFGPPTASAPPAAVDWVVRIASPSLTVADLEAAFAAIDYDFRTIRDGQRPVPRVRVDTVPEDLGQVPEVSRRKSLFFASVLPLVLAVNEQIAHERESFETIKRKIRSGQTLTDEERTVLSKLADKYEVIDQDEIEKVDVTSNEVLDILDVRVAPIPVSLALAQAAEESAWGMSRFAVEGNALYGQWVWNDGAGIVPEARGVGERHSVRAFRDLYESTRAYAHNLNTHWAYRDFRRMRAAMMLKGNLSGQDLAAALQRYSERSPLYVDSLRKIIRGNGLAPLDNARFSEPGLSVQSVATKLALVGAL